MPVPISEATSGNNPLKYTDPTGYLFYHKGAWLDNYKDWVSNPFGSDGVGSFQSPASGGGSRRGDSRLDAYSDFVKSLGTGGLELVITYTDWYQNKGPDGAFVKTNTSVKITITNGGAPDMIDWSKGGRTLQILNWMKHIELAYADPNFTYPAEATDRYGSAYRISDIVKRQGGTVGGNMGPNWKTESYQGSRVDVFYLQNSNDFINSIGIDDALKEVGQYVLYMQGSQCGNCSQPVGLMGIQFSSFSQFNNAWRYIYGKDYQH